MGFISDFTAVKNWSGFDYGQRIAGIFIGKIDPNYVMADKREHEVTGRTVFQSIVASLNSKLVEIMLEKGANPNGLKGETIPPLVRAAESQTMTAVVLLDKGANLNVSNSKGQTPLMLATTNGNKILVDSLKYTGARR